MAAKLSQTQFIEKASVKHAGRYGYEKAIYIDSYYNVMITCHTHGDFSQRPALHLAGQGCPKCARIKISLNGIATRFKKKHDIPTSAQV